MNPRFAEKAQPTEDDLTHKNEIITFTVKCTMRRRWAWQFLGMLNYMQALGSIGSSREVTLFADGDGDFRPKFKYDETIPRALAAKNNDGNVVFDAG